MKKINIIIVFVLLLKTTIYAQNTEISIKNPSYEKMENVLLNINNYWKYSKTEYVDKNQEIKTEIRKYEVPEDKHKISELPKPGEVKTTSSSTPTMTPTMSATNDVKEDKNLESSIELFNPLFSYVFTQKIDSGGLYSIFQIDDKRNVKVISTAELSYTISNKKGVPTLTIANLMSGEEINFIIMQCSSSSLILNNLSSRNVHYFYKSTKN